MQTVSAIPRPTLWLAWRAAVRGARPVGDLGRRAAPRRRRRCTHPSRRHHPLFNGRRSMGAGDGATDRTSGGMSRRLAISVCRRWPPSVSGSSPRRWRCSGSRPCSSRCSPTTSGRRAPGLRLPGIRRCDSSLPAPSSCAWFSPPGLGTADARRGAGNGVRFKRDLCTAYHRPFAEAAPWARRSTARCRAGLSIHSKASAAVGY